MKLRQKVKVIKPFFAVRTPCPPQGTVGTIHRELTENGYIGVSFPLPMVDTEGNTWLSQGDNTDVMQLLFLPEEIEKITPTE